MTRVRCDGEVEIYECERCDCVVALVDTAARKPSLRAGSYITGQPEPRDGCECACHISFRIVGGKR